MDWNIPGRLLSDGDAERDRLAERISLRGDPLGYTDAMLSCLLGVHASQISRICRADFRTISSNVMQICNVLALAIEPPEQDDRAAASDWIKIEDAVRRAWDETPDGAAKLVRVMEAIAAISRR